MPPSVISASSAPQQFSRCILLSRRELWVRLARKACSVCILQNAAGCSTTWYFGCRFPYLTHYVLGCMILFCFFPGILNGLVIWVLEHNQCVWLSLTSHLHLCSAAVLIPVYLIPFCILHPFFAFGLSPASSVLAAFFSPHRIQLYIIKAWILFQQPVLPVFGSS